jgi:thiosulfate/3-mercaptopyruvate sulfurtransferase
MSLEISSRGYCSPDSLVSTEWLAENLNNPNLRILESNEDPLLYKTGHIPNALEIDWVNDLNQPIVRDYLDSDQFSSLMTRLGISTDTTIILYGDKNNWWATYALWVFHLFGHENVKIMDGGRLKWEMEGRELTKNKLEVPHTNYQAKKRDNFKYRAFKEEVMTHLSARGKMIDVRSPDEFSGKRLHMEAYPNEGALRGGHIPGAKNVPWARAINTEDGSFKTYKELAAIYLDESGLKASDDTITYCRIGERSSHTWFVLKYLLGFDKVRNYDGSWTEWGNLVGVPIEK